MEFEETVPPEDQQAELLEDCFKRLNLNQDTNEGSKDPTQSKEELFLEDRLDDSNLEALARGVMKALPDEVQSRVGALLDKIKYRKDDVCKFVVSDEFLNYLYNLLVSNTNEKLQIKVLAIFSSLSSKPHQTSDRLYVVPILERAFDVVKACTHFDAMKEAFRVIGNTVSGNQHPLTDLFAYTDLLLNLITTVYWNNQAVVDYAAWALCNLWSFKSNRTKIITQYFETHNLSIMYVLGAVITKFTQKSNDWGLTVWVCCIFLEQLLIVTNDFSMFSQPGVLEGIVKIVKDLENEERVRYTALRLLEMLSRNASPYTKGLMDTNLIEGINNYMLIQGCSSKMQRLACKLLANICDSNCAMARKLVSSVNLIDRFKSRISNPHTGWRERHEYIRVLCSPAYSIPPEELLKYCSESNVFSLMLEYVLNNASSTKDYATTPEEHALNSLILVVNKLSERYPISKQVVQYFEQLDLLLYMISTCFGNHKKLINHLAEGLLKKVRTYALNNR